jgi:hypothetical protein
MIEKIHYVSDNHNNYPHSCCGVTGISANKTKIIEKVTCKKCITISNILADSFWGKKNKRRKNMHCEDCDFCNEESYCLKYKEFLIYHKGRYMKSDTCKKENNNGATKEETK